MSGEWRERISTQRRGGAEGRRGEAGTKGTKGTKGTHGGDEAGSGCGAELVMRSRGMTVVAMAGTGGGAAGSVGSGQGAGMETGDGGQGTGDGGRETGDGGQGTGDGGRGADGTAGATGTAGTAGTGSGRLREKRASAGRGNAVVKDRGDRRKVRAEVQRIVGLGLSKSDACSQVAEQMRDGHVGEKPLTMKYNLPGMEATPAVVARICRAKW